jgi:N-acetylmuramoyl-L-alanine amidase
MRISNHRLLDNDGNPVTYENSPNCSGAITPTYLVMHFTAGRSYQSSVDWLQNKHAKASAHLVIGRQGQIVQMVPFNKKAWHAGPSRWKGQTGLNKHSIGIELANAGPLTEQNGQWRAWYGAIIPPENVIKAPHKLDGIWTGWEIYPEVQIDAAMDAALAIVSKYDLLEVLGHEEISPNRKRDPGPAFPMESFRAKLIGRKEDSPDPQEYLTIENLNIRTGPGVQYDRIIDSGLPPSTTVRCLEKQTAWWNVDVQSEVEGHKDLTGWVHSRFLTLA